MNVWKVILATLVIYSAGLITGSLLMRPRFPPHPLPERLSSPPGPIPWLLQQRFLERMRAELDLTPNQTARLERVLAESRERVRIINDLVRPEMQAEMRNTREQIKAELRPEQRRRFEELMRSRPGSRINDPSFRPGQRPRNPPDERFDSRPTPSNPAPLPP